MTTEAPTAQGLAAAYGENWIFFQRNTDGSNQWKDDPRLYLPWRLGGGWTFTQRVDVPYVYTNQTGPGHPGTAYSGGLGDAYIEEIFESPQVVPNLRLRASVRFVFPTGRQKPFGSSQYQWAPGSGFTWTLPHVWRGVTIDPFVRYFSGFDPSDDAKEVRKLEIYPAAAFSLGNGWSLTLYPENPITYNAANGTWFVPLDTMLTWRVSDRLHLGAGGAVRLGHSSDPAFSYVIDARAILNF